MIEIQLHNHDSNQYFIKLEHDIFHKVELLQLFPKLGSEVIIYGITKRKIVIKDFILFYSVYSDHVFIECIFHKNENYLRHIH